MLRKHFALFGFFSKNCIFGFFFNLMRNFFFLFEFFFFFYIYNFWEAWRGGGGIGLGFFFIIKI